MEENKITLTESLLRQVIQEELKDYLIEEGLMDDAKTKLKRIFGASLPLMLLFADARQSAKVLAQTREEISSDDMMQQFDQMVDKEQEKLKSFGLQEDGAQQIIAGVVAGARQEKEKELEYNRDLSEEEKESQILDHQMQQLSLLDNQENVKNVLLAKFQKDMEQQGRTLMVKAQTSSGGTGAPVPIDSIVVGLGDQLQKELIQSDKDITIKKGDKLGFNPMDLRSYWDNLVVDNGPMDKQLEKEFGGPIFIRNSDYQFAAGEEMNKYVASQIKLENKVQNLKKRLNEIRGLYV